MFYPNPDAEKTWDIIYLAKWYPTKYTEILIQAAKLDLSLKILIYGWPVVSERKAALSQEYKQAIISAAAGLENVTIIDQETGDIQHNNQDGSVVIGSLSKDEMRERFFWHAKSVICLSEKTEAVNRTCAEALCCDVPIMIAPTDGGLETVINSQTGIIIERSAAGIIQGYKQLQTLTGLSPREGYLANYGRQNSNQKFKDIVSDVAAKKGKEVNWDNFQDYGGDPRVLPNVYMTVLGL